jgi:carbonic anhydrase/acetyltransferase-like protein (isoleucine patch superfamily)
MGACILNGAVIGENCLVGAGALVTEGTQFPPGSLIIGSPARVNRNLTPEQVGGLRDSARAYCTKQREFARDLRRVD